MEAYRLTIRGKVVISVVIIILVFGPVMAVKMLNPNMHKAMGSVAAPHESIIMAVEAADLDEGCEKAENSDRQTNTGDTNSEDSSLSIAVEEAYSFSEDKTAFLTFDDGPTPSITPQILEVLDKYEVKATFFVIGYLAEENQAILRELAEAGHALGIHTYSHRYKLIYSSVNSFLAEVQKTKQLLQDVLGPEFDTKLVRFPGGSFSVPEEYKLALKSEGYAHIDWNAINGDGVSPSLSADKLLKQLQVTSKNKKNLVILMHDSVTKQETVKALPGIIEYLREQGYKFALLK